MLRMVFIHGEVKDNWVDAATEAQSGDMTIDSVLCRRVTMGRSAIAVFMERCRCGCPARVSSWTAAVLAPLRAAGPPSVVLRPPRRPHAAQRETQPHECRLLSKTRARRALHALEFESGFDDVVHDPWREPKLDLAASESARILASSPSSAHPLASAALRVRRR
jgi:hypothetical protein